MIHYDLRCARGHRFEAGLASMFSDNPACPDCGEASSRVPSMGGIGGLASAGPSREQMPNTWLGIDRGHPDAVRHWHKQMTARSKLEDKYPELAGDRRPVLAHEGVFADQPLRAGDPQAEKVARATFGSATGKSANTGPENANQKDGTK